MARIIVMHVINGERFFIVWSSVVDAPITGVCSLVGLKKFWRNEYGTSGLKDLEEDLEANGDAVFRSVERMQAYNRAGKNETRLSVAQLVDYFFTDRESYDDPPEGEPWR